MRLTTKGRYAVTAMMDLVIHQNTGPVTLQEIAASQDISLSYLEQLFGALRRAGLVKGTRGPGGGYRLAKPADDITIARIIAAVDEKVDATRCGGDSDCQAGERCLSHELWAHLSQKLYEFLDNITLGEVARWPQVLEVAARQDAKLGRGHEMPRTGLKGVQVVQR